MTKFTPFDEFEKDTLPAGKPLHQTMQENSSASLEPKLEGSCNTGPGGSSPFTCAPYWQATGETRCLSNGLVDFEQKDGCGNSRWTRGIDTVIWTNTGATRCDTPNNKIQNEQMNQCGDIRWLTTATLCCTPDWATMYDNNVPPAPIEDCNQTMYRIREQDGCGNERFRATGQPVTWVSTGLDRCQPGDIYQIQEENQCGLTRWVTIVGGCPCIPEWVNVGPQRCTNEFIENYQSSGCGTVRWFMTNTLVVWTLTGETRCSAFGFIQNQEINQCGITRWVNTLDACVNSPAPIEAGSFGLNTLVSGNYEKTLHMRLTGFDRKLYIADDVSAIYLDDLWVLSTVNISDYEAKITWTADEPVEAPNRVYSGTANGVWYNLGDVSVVGGSFTCRQILGSLSIVWNWSNLYIRIDIRRVGGPIEGGASFGPFVLRAD